MPRASRAICFVYHLVDWKKPARKSRKSCARERWGPTRPGYCRTRTTPVARTRHEGFVPRFRRVPSLSPPGPPCPRCASFRARPNLRTYRRRASRRRSGRCRRSGARAHCTPYSCAIVGMVSSFTAIPRSRSMTSEWICDTRLSLKSISSPISSMVIPFK